MIGRWVTTVWAAMRRSIVHWAVDSDLIDRLEVQKRAAERATAQIETGNVLADTYAGTRSPERRPHVR